MVNGSQVVRLLVRISMRRGTLLLSWDTLLSPTKGHCTLGETLSPTIISVTIGTRDPG
jgi:hypothetical protein